MYSLFFPGRTVFGEGAVNELPQWLPPARRVLLVTGASAHKNGLFDRLAGLIGRDRVVQSEPVGAEPRLAEVDALLTLGRSGKVDCVVAAGGGSVIDAAKIAALLMPVEGMAADYFYQRLPIERPGIPFAALPTTAGTGAEATPNAVLFDPETGLKQSIRSSFMFPALALVDPELTYTCPFAVAAASGMDALTQGIESYVSRGATAPSRALAAAGVRLILNSLEEACREGTVAARRDVAEGCLLGAMAFAQSGLGAVHGLAHPIGAALHLGHGKCCAILLPAVMRWNAAAAATLFDELAPGLPARVDALRAGLGFPATLGAAGLRPEMFDAIVRRSRSGSMRSNPREFSDAELYAILEELL